MGRRGRLGASQRGRRISDEEVANAAPHLQRETKQETRNAMQSSAANLQRGQRFSAAEVANAPDRLQRGSEQKTRNAMQSSAASLQRGRRFSDEEVAIAAPHLQRETKQETRNAMSHAAMSTKEHSKSSRDGATKSKAKTGRGKDGGSGYSILGDERKDILMRLNRSDGQNRWSECTTRARSSPCFKHKVHRNKHGENAFSAKAALAREAEEARKRQLREAPSHSEEDKKEETEDDDFE